MSPWFSTVTVAMKTPPGPGVAGSNARDVTTKSGFIQLGVCPKASAPAPNHPAQRTAILFNFDGFIVLASSLLDTTLRNPKTLFSVFQPQTFSYAH